MLGKAAVGKRSILKMIDQKYVQGKNKHLSIDKMGSDLAQLDSFFLHVKDLESDESQNLSLAAKMHIWALKDNTKMDLLNCAIKKTDLQRTCAMIVLDLSRPWTIESELREWVSCLTAFKNEHMIQIPWVIVCNKVDTCESVASLKDDGLKYVQEYVRCEA
jgi:hypothetical protein